MSLRPGLLRHLLQRSHCSGLYSNRPVAHDLQNQKQTQFSPSRQWNQLGDVALNATVAQSCLQLGVLVVKWVGSLVRPGFESCYPDKTRIYASDSTCFFPQKVVKKPPPPQKKINQSCMRPTVISHNSILSVVSRHPSHAELFAFMGRLPVCFHFQPLATTASCRQCATLLHVFTQARITPHSLHGRLTTSTDGTQAANRTSFSHRNFLRGWCPAP